MLQVTRTVDLIQRIRSSPPSRNVTGGRGNVHARLPSHKMGVTVQSESRTVEKPGMRVFYEYDHMLEPRPAALVIEYYDQPNKILLKYISPSGRNLSVWHTPDFFVIREDGAGWEEWKTEVELEELNSKQPGRYQKDEAGRWRCPPGEAYAAPYGLGYRLRSDAEINWNLFSNLEFLHDYLVENRQTTSSTASEALIQYVNTHQGTTLEMLLLVEQVTADDIYTLIAQRQLYVNLMTTRLTYPDRVQVFTSSTAAEGHQYLRNLTQVEWHILEFQPGTHLAWDGQDWVVVNLGASEVMLRHTATRQAQTISRQEFETALTEGRISGQTLPDDAGQPHPQLQAVWAAATEADYAIANCRLTVLKALDSGETLEAAWDMEGIREVLGEQKDDRTIRRWRRRFADAERVWGNGYTGLLPGTGKRGNRERKLPEATLEKMRTFIETRYEDLRQPHASSVWVEFKQACETEDIPPASLKTFGQQVKLRPRDIQTGKRQGKRAANQVAKRYWYLEETTPKHGERAWQIVHIDHTRLDLQLRHTRTGKNLGRPWATFAVDAYSRRLLAAVLTLDDQPSYRNCMMVLREMVRRFHRLPQTIYVDNGMEFKSTYFQALLAQYGVEVDYRPAAQPRFGDVVERLFLTANTQFVYNLTGNTQIARQVRLMTKSNDPRNLAVWNLGWLYLALREWAYEIYDQSEHTTLHQSPREAFDDSLRLHGERSFKWIDYPSFILNALPSPDNGGLRKVQPSGVKIDHIYYWHDLMYRPDIAGTKVPVRYDPFNIGVAYAYLDRVWVRCTSEYFVTLQGRSEQELLVAKEELRASYRRHGRVVHLLNARLLADFLKRTGESERLQSQQLRDNAMGLMRACVNDNLLDGEIQARLATEYEESSPVDHISPLQGLTSQPDPRPIELDGYEHLELPVDF